SGDTYELEHDAGIARATTPINIGVSYRPLRFVELGTDWIQGHILAGRLSLKMNLKNPRVPAKLDPPPPDIHVRTDDEMRRGLTDLLAAQGAEVSKNEDVPAHGARWINAADLENAPDWSMYPASFTNLSPDMRSPSLEVTRRLEAGLAN